jgi:hypothetical protein
MRYVKDTSNGEFCQVSILLESLDIVQLSLIADNVGSE